MQSRYAATLHHLVVALHVRRDEDDLGSKPCPRVFEKFHSVRPAASFLRVPEDHSLGFDMLPDQARYRRPERSLLVGTYPDQEPVGALDARRERGTNTSPGTNTDTPLEHCGGMTDASCDRVSER